MTTPPLPDPQVQPSASAELALWRSPAMRALLGVSLLGFTSFCLTVASLPTYAVRGGADPGVAGLVTTALLVVTVLAQLSLPPMVSRFGSRRILGVGLVALGLPAPFLLISDDLGWLVALSGVRGIGFAALTVLGATFTARLAPPERRGAAIGLYGLSVAVPNLLAVPAGTALVLADQFVVVAILAGCAVLAAPLVLLLPRDGAAPIRTEATESTDSVRPAATSTSSAVRAVLAPSVVLLAVTLSAGGVVTFLPIERPDGVVATGALVLFGLSSSLTRWRAGAIFDRTGSPVLLPASVLAAAVGMGLLALGVALGPSSGAVGVATIFVAATLYGGGYGAAQNLTLLAAFRRAGEAHQTTASSVWNAFFDFGLGSGALLVGAFAVAGAGLAGSYLACVALILVTLPLTWVLGRGSRR